MLKKIIKYFLRSFIILLLVILIIIGLPRLMTERFFQVNRATVDTVSKYPVAIIFGAGLRNGAPSAVLRDRIETAALLYHAGKIEKLLMSGDNRFVDYNEPQAMRDYAITLGVMEQDIVLDYAGRRTYDTCYRARHIFGVRKAILVTQSFHLPRALYICGNLDIQIAGVPADIRRYSSRSYAFWNIRELPATAITLWEVWVSRPLPVLGKPEPIFASRANKSIK